MYLIFMQTWWQRLLCGHHMHLIRKNHPTPPCGTLLDYAWLQCCKCGKEGNPVSFYAGCL